jgi:maltose O-acetyltransferase
MRLRGVNDPLRLVRAGLQLGKGVFLADGVFIDSGHPWLISIGDDSVIAPRVMIFTHDAAMRIQTGYTMIAPVSIGTRVYVGAGAIILPDTMVGDDCVIGAGAVVKGTFPPRSVIAGSPARVVDDVDSLAGRHLAAVNDGPCWPVIGWNSYTGISQERRQAQREALGIGVRGYMVARKNTAAKDADRDGAANGAARERV